MISIYYMPSSSETSSSTYYISTSTPVVVDPSYLSNSTFQSDDEILEALTNIEFMWDDMHHHAYFLPHEFLLEDSNQNNFLVNRQIYHPFD